MRNRLIEVRQHVLKKNDEVARALRGRFERAGVLVVSLVSSPGAGKTILLERTLRELLSAGHRAAALVGDLATDNDARILARSGAYVRQITTGSVCHLEAAMIEECIEDFPLSDLDYLFIENVGNLVCPASFDLGEAFRTVLLSVTEGEDKPRKYPSIFNTSDVAIITKSDLGDVVGFDRLAALAAIHSVRPGMHVLELSAKQGLGLDAWLELLHQHRCSCWPGRAGCASRDGNAFT